MVVGIAKIEIFFPEPNSLKSKRKILKALIHKLESQFKKISLAEVDGHDLWQKTTLGISIVGKDQKFVDSKLTSILNFIKNDGNIEIIKAEIDFISY
ncbi:protein of unknown function DUF503 [Thermodesulfobacterium geofontis OPF15]|jgi:uncharacterized protein YlxP (DUF503 family)|uniref:DUF503 domain-containing protein n=2 Tax=Thermodesulfobacterium geofontis TaxID=1295609 RepID=F8C621_THEGP|nr:DUF503 domain-containing protein [Thermodesulfobacterium geofontis]AEH23169.1 protein of unknown function DUF503 [Thermodesulfobacterium geofontis OPF15]